MADGISSGPERQMNGYGKIDTVTFFFQLNEKNLKPVTFVPNLFFEGCGLQALPPLASRSCLRRSKGDPLPKLLRAFKAHLGSRLRREPFFYAATRRKVRLSRPPPGTSRELPGTIRSMP